VVINISILVILVIIAIVAILVVRFAPQLVLRNACP
jgi:hypothetical protein